MQRLVAPCLSVAAVLSCVAQVAAQPPRPGSVLVFPKHHSSATPTSAFSIVAVTNTNLQPFTPLSFGGSTGVHLTFVNVIPNQANPFQPLNCVEFNRHQFLTPGDTLAQATRCVNATAPGNDSGYLVVAAEDPARFDTPWSFNHLLGSMTILEPSGAAYSYDAIPFRSPLPTGSQTDLNGNGALDFNGLEYDRIPDQAFVDQFITGVGSRLSLINLTGARRDRNLLLLSIWNDDEVPLSSTLEFSCWFDQPLTAISPLFNPGFFASLPNDPNELDVDCDNVGDFETGWLIIDSVRVRDPGGIIVSNDGATLGVVQAFGTQSYAARSLWGSNATQSNGAFGGAFFDEPGQHVRNARALVRER